MVFIRLLIAELKAMICKLPKIFAGGMVLVFAVLLFSYVMTSYSQKTDGGKNVIAISAPDDTFMTVALTAVENMESVSKICKFDRVNEDEAEAMVLDNRASAAIIFENNFVEDIINGKNTKPRIIVSQNSNKLFMDLANCGSSMLAIVQAAIYSAEGAYYDKTGKRLSADLNKELNMEYINSVFSRERNFKKFRGDDISVAEYYIAMLLPVFLLLFSMSFSTIIYPQSKKFYEYSKLSSLSISVIQFIKVFLINIVLMSVFKFICVIVDFSLSFNILAIVSVSAIVTAIYSVSLDKVSGSLFILIFTIVTGFLSGAFLTPALMPVPLRYIMEFIPLNVIGFQLMGEWNIPYTLGILAICLILMVIGGKRK